MNMQQYQKLYDAFKDASGKLETLTKAISDLEGRVVELEGVVQKAKGIASAEPAEAKQGRHEGLAGTLRRS